MLLENRDRNTGWLEYVVYHFIVMCSILCESYVDSAIIFFVFNLQIENAFNIGSPLGVFLVLKGIRPRDDLEQHILPTSVCSRYYNIYHPADPIVGI